MPETEAAPAAPVPQAPVAKVAADATITEAPKEAVDMTLPGGEKMLAAIGYIGFFCVLPILAKPKSEMCQHHGKQAMAVTLMFFIATNALLTITLLIGTSAILYKLTALAYIAWAAVAIMGMMAASAGKKPSLPFFGSIAKKFNW